MERDLVNSVGEGKGVSEMSRKPRTFKGLTNDRPMLYGKIVKLPSIRCGLHFHGFVDFHCSQEHTLPFPIGVYWLAIGKIVK